MSDPSDSYAGLVERAEKAVASVKDPELRRVAFEKILDDLLATRDAVGSTGRRKGEKTTASSSSKPVRRVSGKAAHARGPKAYIKEIIADGFFKKPKTMAQVKAELANRGHHIALTSLSGPLQKLCQEHVLRRQKTTSGNKQTYAYSEW